MVSVQNAKVYHVSKCKVS